MLSPFLQWQPYVAAMPVLPVGMRVQPALVDGREMTKVPALDWTVVTQVLGLNWMVVTQVLALVDARVQLLPR